MGKRTEEHKYVTLLQHIFKEDKKQGDNPLGLPPKYRKIAYSRALSDQMLRAYRKLTPEQKQEREEELLKFFSNLEKEEGYTADGK